MVSTKSIAALLFAAFLLQSPVLAEECDCIKKRAGAGGPGACSLSESESWCQISFRSVGQTQEALAVLGGVGAIAPKLGPVAGFVPDRDPVWNAFLTVTIAAEVDNPDSKDGRFVASLNPVVLMNSLLIVAAVSAANANLDRSGGELQDFAKQILALTEPEGQNERIAKEIFSEFLGANELSYKPLFETDELRLYAARLCFEVITNDEGMRAMVQAPGAPAAATCRAE